jgi:hypothetical protein
MDPAPGYPGRIPTRPAPDGRAQSRTGRRAAFGSNEADAGTRPSRCTGDTRLRTNVIWRVDASKLLNIFTMEPPQQVRCLKAHSPIGHRGDI